MVSGAIGHQVGRESLADSQVCLNIRVALSTEVSLERCVRR